MLVADVQTKWFPDFQPLCAPRHLCPKLFRCPLAKVVAMHSPGIPVHAAKDYKSLRGGGFKFIKMLVQNILTPAAIQVNIYTHISHIQRIQYLIHRALIPTAAKFPKVVVGVDDRETRFFDVRHFGDEFGLWLKFAQKKIILHVE